MPPKLISLTLPHPHPDALRWFPRTIEFAKPLDSTIGWSVSIRGPAVFVVGPPGWTRGGPTTNRRSKGGPRLAFEFARTQCVEAWEIADDAELDKIQKYDSPVIAYEVAPVDAPAATGGAA